MSMWAIALAQTFWAFVAAAVVMGAFRALDSGPLEAWFVDTVHLTEPGADVDQQLSRAGTVLGGAIAVGAILSGGLIWWDPVRTVFGVSGVSALDAAAWVSAALAVVHLVFAAQHLRAFDHRDRAAKAPVRLRQFYADGPAADDDQMPGPFAQAEDRLVREVGDGVDAQDLRHQRARSGGDDEASGTDCRIPGLHLARAGEAGEGADHGAA